MPAPGSPGGDPGHPLQVIGEDSQPDPATSTREPPQPGAPQPEAALEVTDAGLDADPPVAQPPEGPGPLQRQPRLAGGAGALQPDPPDPERFQGLVVGGGAESAVTDDRGGHSAGD